MSATFDRAGFVYLVEGDHGRYYKIGRSVNVPTRMKAFAAMKLPFKTRLLHFIPSGVPNMAELMLHRYFAPRYINGEWFALRPNDIKIFMGYDTAHLDNDAISYLRGNLSFLHELPPPDRSERERRQSLTMEIVVLDG